MQQARTANTIPFPTMNIESREEIMQTDTKSDHKIEPRKQETMIQALRRHLNAVTESINNGGLPENTQDAIVEWQSELERRFAQAAPTCLEDAIILMETVEDDYSTNNFYPKDQPLELVGDYEACMCTLMRQVLTYLKSLRTGTPAADPVVSLWNEYQVALDNAHKIGERDDGVFLRMSEKEKKQYKKQYPDFNAHDCSIEHQRAYELAEAIEKQFISTPAQSADGVMLQVEFAKKEDWIDEVMKPLMHSIRRGLDNLQLKPLTQETIDPIIALAEKEKIARKAFSDADEENDEKGYGIAEKAFNEAANALESTPATTLEGLLIQAKYIQKHHPEIGILVEGIKNLTEHRITGPDPVLAYAKAFDRADKEFETVDVPGASQEDYRPIFDRMNEAEEKLETTPACTPEGIAAQVKSLIRFLDGFEDENNERSLRTLRVIEAGLKNLQKH